MRTNQVKSFSITTLASFNSSFSHLDPEIMETFDRANYRQSGSSLDSNNDFKKKKSGKIFKLGMFK